MTAALEPWPVDEDPWRDEPPEDYAGASTVTMLDHDRANIEPIRAPRGKQGPSASTVAIRMALDSFRLVVTDEGTAYALPLDGPQVLRAFRGGKTSLRRAVMADYFEATGTALPSQATAEALDTLEGMAQRGDPEPVDLRVAEREGDFYLDMGDPTGRAVKITTSGWEVVDRAPVLFRRTALTGPLPSPTRGGTLEDLWQVLNVTDLDRPLVLAWLVGLFVPDMPHAVLCIGGEAGSGKSTASRALAGLVDPSPAQLQGPPTRPEDWTLRARQSWAVGVDNVRAIPNWWSDQICRTVTGEAEVRRVLFTDGDMFVLAFRRPVLINAIDLGALPSDLANRVVTISLDRITETGRRLDSELTKQWADAHPRALGALLDLTVRVLAAMPGLTMTSYPRMADFARMLAAVDHVMGTDGLPRFLSQAGDLATDAVEGDPVLFAITDRITTTWTGTAGDLLAMITPDTEGWRPPKGWPVSARALTTLLRNRGLSLRALGWSLVDLGRGGPTKTLRWELSPPQGQATPQATAGVTGKTAGVTGNSAASCLPAGDPVTCENAKTAGETGKTGDRYPSSLLLTMDKKEREGAERPDTREGGQTLPVLPVTPGGWSAETLAEDRAPLTCRVCTGPMDHSLAEDRQHPGCEIGGPKWDA